MNVSQNAAVFVLFFLMLQWLIGRLGPTGGCVDGFYGQEVNMFRFDAKMSERFKSCTEM